jgi:hypothetical protein
MNRAVGVLTGLVCVLTFAIGCRDLSRFTSGGDRFEGPVVHGDFVRAGVDPSVTVCMTIDTDHLQDTPGRISSSDGRFKTEPLRPIPQLWHDPLSTLSFGEGREKNLVYVASPSASFADGGDGGDVMVVVSLMTTGAIEVRLLRGAPPANAADAGATTAPPSNVFAIFDLARQSGPCSY